MSGRPKGWGIARRGRELRRDGVLEMLRLLVHDVPRAAVGALRAENVTEWMRRRGVVPRVRYVRVITDPRHVREASGRLDHLLLLPGWEGGGVGAYVRECAGAVSGRHEMEHVARMIFGGTSVWTGGDVDDVLGFEERRPTHEEMVSWNASDGDFRERAERVLKRPRSGVTTLVPRPGRW